MVNKFHSLDVLKAYIEVTKPLVTLLLAFGGLAGGFIAYRTNNLYTILMGTIAVIVAASGINAITNYIDRDIDKVMERTKCRPIPSGRITPPENALYLGIILILISLFMVYPHIYSCIWILIGVLFDPLLYNYLTKRRTEWNIIIGSFAGGAPVFVVWSYITNQFFSILPFFVFVLIVLWTPVHIWSIAIRYFDDYKKAKIPMLPVVQPLNLSIRLIGLFTGLMFVFSILLFEYISLNNIIFSLMVVLNIILLLLVIKLFITPTKHYAYILFKLSSPYLAVIFFLIIVIEIFKL